MHASPGAVPEVDYSQGDAVNINALYLHSIPLKTAAVASTTIVTTSTSSSSSSSPPSSEKCLLFSAY